MMPTEVERRDDRAGGADAFRRLQSESAGDQRSRVLDADVVQVVFALAPDLQHVAEAFGGDQPRAGAAPFDQRVGEQRCGVHDAADARGGQGGLVQHAPHRGQHGLRRVAVGGQHLQRRAGAGCGLVQHKVGEGAADVDAEGVGLAGEGGRHDGNTQPPGRV
jgi:hypothetical protein